MKQPFKETNKIRNQKPKDLPIDNKPPFDFKMPQYDQRHSDFVRAGVNYGIGINQPVGSSSNPKMKVDVLPYGTKVTNEDIP